MLIWKTTLKEKFGDDTPREAEIAVGKHLETEFSNVTDYEPDAFCQRVVGVDFSAWDLDEHDHFIVRPIGIQVRQNWKKGQFVVEVDTVINKSLVNRYYHVNENCTQAIMYWTENMLGYLQRHEEQLANRVHTLNGKRCIYFKEYEFSFTKIIGLHSK